MGRADRADAPVTSPPVEPDNDEKSGAEDAFQRFKKVKEVCFVEGLIEADVPLREGPGGVRLEALRSPGESDYLVAVYREREVALAEAKDDEHEPPAEPGKVRVWAAYDVIRGTAPTPERALRQVLWFLEMRCA